MQYLEAVVVRRGGEPSAPVSVRPAVLAPLLRVAHAAACSARPLASGQRTAQTFQPMQSTSPPRPSHLTTRQHRVLTNCVTKTTHELQLRSTDFALELEPRGRRGWRRRNEANARSRVRAGSSCQRRRRVCRAVLAADARVLRACSGACVRCARACVRCARMRDGHRPAWPRGRPADARGGLAACSFGPSG